MPTTVTLDDGLAIKLGQHAKKRKKTMSEYVTQILEDAVNGDGMNREDAEELTEVLRKTRSTGQSAAAIRQATGSLSEALSEEAPGAQFDVEQWDREWAAVEDEIRSATEANDIAERKI